MMSSPKLQMALFALDMLRSSFSIGTSMQASDRLMHWSRCGNTWLREGEGEGKRVRVGVRRERKKTSAGGSGDGVRDTQNQQDYTLVKQAASRRGTLSKHANKLDSKQEVSDDKKNPTLGMPLPGPPTARRHSGARPHTGLHRL